MRAFAEADGPPDWFNQHYGAEPPPDDETRQQRADDEPPLDDIYRDDEGGFDEPLDILGNAEIAGYPELSLDCLPKPIYRYAMAEGKRLNADPVPIAIHCLAAVSVAASDDWGLKAKQHDFWTQQARLWTCCVKPPGARGTDMLATAFWPIQKREADLRRDFQREHAAWQERMTGLKGKELAEAAKADPEPRQKRLLTNDATVEALSELLRGKDEAAKIGYYADELATFLDFGRYKSGKGGGGSRAFMLQAFDGGPQQIDRILRGSVFVANWSVAIAGNIQPRKLAELGTELASDGLFQRFIVVHAKESELYDDDDQPTDQAARAAYSDLITKLFDLRPPKGAHDKAAVCYLDEAGRAVRRQLMRLVQRLQHDASLPDLIREAASKWSGLFSRLCLIFHLVEVADRTARGETPADHELVRVPAATAEKAAALIREVVLPNLFRLGFETLPDGKEQANARWIAEHILTHRSEHLTARDIGRAFRKLRGKPQEIAGCMEILTHAGWATQTEARADGVRWKINPKVHVQFAAAAKAERARRDAVKALIRQKVREL